VSKLPCLSGKQTISILEKFGFKVLRQRESHIILKKEATEGLIGCVVPNHKELARGTLKGILRQANIEVEEFIKKI